MERRVAGIKGILDVLRQASQTSRLTTTSTPTPETTSAERSTPQDTSSASSSTLPSPPTPGSGPGQALIFAWALEQSSSRRGWKDGDEQDVLVPWVLKPSDKGSRAPTSSTSSRPPQQATEQAGDAVAEDHGGAVEQKSEQVAKQDPSIEDREERKEKVFNRFYHLYRQGELEEECAAAGGEVLAKGYDRDNWWVVVAPAARGKGGVKVET